MAYNRHSDEFILLGIGADIELELTQLTTVIFQELSKYECFENFYQSKVIKKINHGKNLLYIQKRIHWFIANNVLSTKRPFPINHNRYKINYTFSNSYGAFKEISYTSHDTPIAEKWCQLLILQKSKYSKCMDDGIVFSRNFKTKEKLLEELILLNKKIHTFLNDRDQLIDKSILCTEFGLNQSDLNQLHLLFEKLYNHPSLETEDEFNGDLRSFNMLIHQCEEAISNNEGGLIELVYEKAIGPLKLLDLEKKYFSTDIKFGEIYLNYLQIGHSVIGAFECQSDSPPQKQEYFNPNHFLSFRPNSNFGQMDELSNWALKKFGIDLSKGQWCLGHIPLASIDSNTDLSLDNIDQFLKDFSNLETIHITKLEKTC
jgi:hypothetical protein